MKLENIEGKEKMLRIVRKIGDLQRGVTFRLTGEALPPPGGASHIHPYSPSKTPQATTETTTYLPFLPPQPNTVVKSGWGSRPTCQWLQLDQGTARARGNHGSG